MCKRPARLEDSSRFSVPLSPTHEPPKDRQVLDCVSPLALWLGQARRVEKRQRTGAVQDARAWTEVHGPNARPKLEVEAFHESAKGRQVLECASPLALWLGPSAWVQSARGLAQSKTLSRPRRFTASSRVRILEVLPPDEPPQGFKAFKDWRVHISERFEPFGNSFPEPDSGTPDSSGSRSFDSAGFCRMNPAFLNDCSRAAALAFEPCIGTLNRVRSKSVRERLGGRRRSLRSRRFRSRWQSSCGASES